MQRGRRPGGQTKTLQPKTQRRDMSGLRPQMISYGEDDLSPRGTKL
jgi:hypothetical protein